MTEYDSIDFNSILNTCNQSQNIAQTFSELEAKYSLDEMTQIYNFLLQNLQNPEVLMFIIRRINTYKPTECLDTLLDLLLLKSDYKEKFADNDKYIDLRVNAAKVISNYKDNRAVLPILYCMNNKGENYKIRLACAEALGKIGDKYAVSPLIDLVSDEEEKSVYVRESAATALGMLGDMRAIDPLVHILEAKKTFLDKFTFLKERVIEALGKINSPNERVFSALKNSLEDESPQIRINAIEALMNSGDERAVELIKKALFDNDAEVVENALIALFNIDGKSILEAITENEEYSLATRECARTILEEYGDDEDE